jgi:hypothetical protein
MSRLTQCARALASLSPVDGAAIAQTHGDGAAVEHVLDGPDLPPADLQIEATAVDAN